MASIASWPLDGLRVRTPDLELRLPDDGDLAVLAGLAAEGIHDPAAQPFTAAWTDARPDERARSVLQYQWGLRAAWTPADWSLELAVIRDGSVVGSQGLSAREFAVCREVSTGSWLGRAHQGQGIGTQMRAAVLWLAFAGLGAEYATSGAFLDNPASLAVSRRLGYRDDGIEVHAIRGRPAVLQRLRLDRATWLATRPRSTQLDGLEPCLPMFGLRGRPGGAGS
jgi:RimJ/RimL family protein N-acetyltransferase